jgi:hypothetical protein
MLLSVCEERLKIMDSATPHSPHAPQSELDALSQQVIAIAHQSEGDSLALLALLRVLERLHREICEGAFQASLPNTRQALYSLLRDIESEGGWPHIPRMKLQAFLSEFFIENPEGVDDSSTAPAQD